MTKDRNAVRFKLKGIFWKSYGKFCTQNSWVFTLIWMRGLNQAEFPCINFSFRHKPSSSSSICPRGAIQERLYRAMGLVLDWDLCFERLREMVFRAHFESLTRKLFFWLIWSRLVDEINEIYGFTITMIFTVTLTTIFNSMLNFSFEQVKYQCIFHSKLKTY